MGSLFSLCCVSSGVAAGFYGVDLNKVVETKAGMMEFFRKAHNTVSHHLNKVHIACKYSE